MKVKVLCCTVWESYCWSCNVKVIFVADIFGVTDEFKHLCQQATLALEQQSNVECHLIGPYHKSVQSFSSEKVAYQYFNENVSLAGYVKKLKQKLSQIPGRKLLVGFSVGGSAIWQLISTSIEQQNLAAICFYSSQIRQMTKLTPKIATKLILPATEPHFSVLELSAKLAAKPSVTIEHSKYLHGFMNQQSMNFEPQAYQHYIKVLADFLSQKCIQSLIDK